MKLNSRCWIVDVNWGLEFGNIYFRSRSRIPTTYFIMEPGAHVFLIQLVSSWVGVLVPILLKVNSIVATEIYKPFGSRIYILLLATA